LLISVSQDILPFCVVAVIVVVAFELSFYFFSWLRTADSFYQHTGGLFFNMVRAHPGR
jgi:hypothetical protein